MTQPTPKPEPGVMFTVTQAARHTGESRSTIHRRADRWLAGHHDEDALKARRVGRGAGARILDSWDCERVRRQRVGDLAPYVTPTIWLQAWPAAAT